MQRITILTVERPKGHVDRAFLLDGDHNDYHDFSTDGFHPIDTEFNRYKSTFKKNERVEFTTIVLDVSDEDYEYIATHIDGKVSESDFFNRAHRIVSITPRPFINC